MQRLGFEEMLAELQGWLDFYVSVLVGVGSPPPRRRLGTTPPGFAAMPPRRRASHARTALPAPNGRAS